MDLTAAINNRNVLTFFYDGLPRLVQPATYGQTTTGKWTLRGCQVSGSSQNNTVPGWALFSEAKMVDLTLPGETFVNFALAGYTRGDSAFVNIVAEH